MNIHEYQAIIIGAGQGGIPLAASFRDAGWRVALIEKDHLGGTCVNIGCTPTKTMIASGRVAYLAKRAADYGVHMENIQVDLKKVKQRKDAVVQTFRDGLATRLEGVDIIKGEAKFISSHSIQVNDQTLNSEKIFINTGARPSKPPVPGLDQVPYLDSTSIMELEEVPEHLMVLGGGYIGLEFGQLFRRFGSRVTILTHGKQILSREDEDIAHEMQQILEEDGIEVICNVQLDELKPGPELHFNGRTLQGSHLLVATGRIPNTDGLNLPVETDEKGFIKVNERLETDIPGIWAIGDVKGGPAFTHISYDDYRILRDNLLNGGVRTTKNRQVPYTLFNDPQLGRIGMTEKQAQKLGLDYAVAKIPMSYVARAIEMDETRGLIKAIVDQRTDRILGAAVIGIEGGELMAIFQVAMMGDLPHTKLANAIFAHPTLAESLNTLFSHIESYSPSS